MPHILGNGQVIVIKDDKPSTIMDALVALNQK